MRKPITAILSMSIAALMLVSCASLPVIGGGIDMNVIADRIGVERDASGQIDREGRLMANATILLAVTEAASARALDPGERTILAAQLTSAAQSLLDAAQNDGWFVEQDAQEAINVAGAVIGRDALNRALRVSLSGPTVEGARDLFASAAIASNTAAGVRRINLAYRAGEITEAEAIDILRARFERALLRLRGVP